MKTVYLHEELVYFRYSDFVGLHKWQSVFRQVRSKA